MTEEQVKLILAEELGIAKKVVNLTQEIQNNIFDSLNNNITNDNFLVDSNNLTISWKVIEFNNESELYSWLDNNIDQYINGYSKEKQTIYLTMLSINQTIDIDNLKDTIQHEVHHYYQESKKPKNKNQEAYNEVIKNFNAINPYLMHFARLMYFNNKFEIEAYVNGAYNVSINKDIESFDDFINSTDLKRIKEILNDGYNFFKNCDFNSYSFASLLVFIKKYNFIKNNGDLKMLRDNILKLYNNLYQYFIKKASRAYALIIKEKEKYKLDFEKEKIKNLNFNTKLYGK
ncbi:MAG: hypothetical protein IKT40_08830 [Bacilli bacterium]|nr:hypothetical protein [Bacilli bacterium]